MQHGSVCMWRSILLYAPGPFVEKNGVLCDSVDMFLLQQIPLSNGRECISVKADRPGFDPRLAANKLHYTGTKHEAAGRNRENRHTASGSYHSFTVFGVCLWSPRLLVDEGCTFVAATGSDKASPNRLRIERQWVLEHVCAVE